MLFLFPLLILPSSTLALVDCLSGFVGQMQGSIEDETITINDTDMCAASYCIKVIVHAALDDDGIFHQGVSSRCAYTGGDRQVCRKNEGQCQDISFYDGMKGNFSFCCCQKNKCNVATKEELSSIYSLYSRSSRKGNSSIQILSFNFLIYFFIFYALFGF